MCIHQLFCYEGLKLLCRAFAVTLSQVQLKLQMQFSYKNTAAKPLEGQTESQRHNMVPALLWQHLHLLERLHLDQKKSKKKNTNHRWRDADENAGISDDVKMSKAGTGCVLSCRSGEVNRQ